MVNTEEPRDDFGDPIIDRQVAEEDIDRYPTTGVPARRIAFGRTLRDIRRARHIDQQKLAEMVGVTRQWISNIERGWPASISLLTKILMVCDVPDAEEVARAVYSDDRYDEGVATLQRLRKVHRRVDTRLEFFEDIAEETLDDIRRSMLEEHESPLVNPDQLISQFEGRARRLRELLQKVDAVVPYVDFGRENADMCKALIYDLSTAAEGLKTTSRAALTIQDLRKFAVMGRVYREVRNALLLTEKVARSLWAAKAMRKGEIIEHDTRPPWTPPPSPILSEVPPPAQPTTITLEPGETEEEFVTRRNAEIMIEQIKRYARGEVSNLNRTLVPLLGNITPVLTRDALDQLVEILRRRNMMSTPTPDAQPEPRSESEDEEAE